MTFAMDVAKREGLVEKGCGDEGLGKGCEGLGGCERVKVEDCCYVEGVEGVKREILERGPVVGEVPLSWEFLVYKDGVFDFRAGRGGGYCS